jgi:hypothetical protein
MKNRFLKNIELLKYFLNWHESHPNLYGACRIYQGTKRPENRAVKSKMKAQEGDPAEVQTNIEQWPLEAEFGFS